MVSQNTRQALLALFNRPRGTADVLVDTLLPQALEENMTPPEVRKLLRDVATKPDGGLDFAQLQKVVLAHQRHRLQELIQGRSRKERGPRVPFQSKAASLLMAVTRRKKLSDQEASIAMTKRRNNYGSAVAPLEAHGEGDQITANVVLCRERGDVGDAWDRYCAVRRKGRSSYVQARNEPRNKSVDWADQHPGASSLVSAAMHSLTRHSGF